MFTAAKNKCIFDTYDFVAAYQKEELQPWDQESFTYVSLEYTL